MVVGLGLIVLAPDPDAVVAGLMGLWGALWFFAGVSKLNHHFATVVAVMTSNSPLLPFRAPRRWMVRAFPDDLGRPPWQRCSVTRGPPSNSRFRRLRGEHGPCDAPGHRPHALPACLHHVERAHGRSPGWNVPRPSARWRCSWAIPA